MTDIFNLYGVFGENIGKDTSTQRATCSVCQNVGFPYDWALIDGRYLCDDCYGEATLQYKKMEEK